MPGCNQCGAEIQSAAVFCSTCGHRQEQSGGQGDAELEPLIASRLRTRISMRRILFMTVASYGIYLFYWFYVTWKQYRDNTGERVYPIWHVLSLFVPIYDLFRVYAHMRAIKNLMTGNGLETTISPGIATIVVAIYFASNSYSNQSDVGSVTYLVLGVVSMIIAAWLLVSVLTGTGTVLRRGP